MPESQSETVAQAVRAATQWIEALTGFRFPADRTFRVTLEDGMLLCELMEVLCPGLLRQTPHLNNLERFLLGCKDLGLSKEQMFDETDLQEASPVDGRGKRKSLNEKLKNVCVTLFWLSQITDYAGPPLDLTPFTNLFPDSQVSAQDEDTLTAEDEQTADELLADIQSAVDDMLNDFQAATLSPELPPPSQPHFTTQTTEPTNKPLSEYYEREPVTVEIRISGGGFGFQVRGGLDTMLKAQVDMVLPGSPAENGGVRSGDEIITVNDRDVTALKHADLVAAIRQAGAQGYISLGLLRQIEEQPSKPLPPEQQQIRQVAALKRMYPKSHQLLDSQLGSMLTPVQEEEIDFSIPLPPLPGEVNDPLPPLPGEHNSFKPTSFQQQATPYISPLPPLPGEDMAPDVAAIVSVRDSVRELENLQKSVDLAPRISPPHSPPPPPPQTDLEEEMTANDLEAMIQQLSGHTSRTSERGEGEGEEQKPEVNETKEDKENEEEKEVKEEEEKIRDQPWEPKAQWEDNNDRVGEGETGGEGRKGKIWSFLEEKTRISNEERAQASKPIQPIPVSKKPPPPKVLPKPVRKPSIDQSGGGGGGGTTTKVENSREGTGGARGAGGGAGGDVGGAGGEAGGEAGGDVGGAGGDSRGEEVFVPSKDPNIITIRSTSSSEPLNIRPVMAEEVELRGDIKILKVAHTRWTPQKKSPEQIKRTTSIPIHSPPTESSPRLPRPGGRYGSTPPTGAVRQASAPQFSLPPSQQKGLKSQQLAEKTRVVPRGATLGAQPGRGRAQLLNGSPGHYDSMAGVARDIAHQKRVQTKLKSRTWGARERSQFTGQPVHPARPALAMPDFQRQDGPQQAFLVRPADPNLPCSLCNRPLGPQPPLIAIPGLHLHFHPNCFFCPVCHTFLTPPRGHNSTTVMVRNMRPHCHYCTSNTEGVQATEC